MNIIDKQYIIDTIKEQYPFKTDDEIMSEFYSYDSLSQERILLKVKICRDLDKWISYFENSKEVKASSLR